MRKQNIKELLEQVKNELPQEIRNGLLTEETISSPAFLKLFFLLGGYVTEDDAIMMASENGYVETVKALIEEGADVRTNDNYAIQEASTYGYKEVVELLIEAGADVKACSGWSVQEAYSNGYKEVVKLLIQFGATF